MATTVMKEKISIVTKEMQLISMCLYSVGIDVSDLEKRQKLNTKD